MPSEDQLAEIRASFEAARSFEDDSEWFSIKSTASTRRSTLISTIKEFQPAIARLKPAVTPAHKQWAVQAAKPNGFHRATLSGSKLNPANTPAMKWEPTASWEPEGQYKKDQEYAPGGISGQGIQKVDENTRWMEGWRFDEYGRPVKVVDGEEASKLESVQARIAERSGRSFG